MQTPTRASRRTGSSSRSSSARSGWRGAPRDRRGVTGFRARDALPQGSCHRRGRRKRPTEVVLERSVGQRTELRVANALVLGPMTASLANDTGPFRVKHVVVAAISTSVRRPSAPTVNVTAAPLASVPTQRPGVGRTGACARRCAFERPRLAVPARRRPKPGVGLHAATRMHPIDGAPVHAREWSCDTKRRVRADLQRTERGPNDAPGVATVGDKRLPNLPTDHVEPKEAIRMDTWDERRPTKRGWMKHSVLCNSRPLNSCRESERDGDADQPARP